jgi:hypothetical protein
MHFTGDIEDTCPISFAPVREIANPVGFESKHAFECDDVVLWITQHKPCNPITTLPVEGNVADVLHPLIVDGNDAHVSETCFKLSQAGRVLPKKATRICQNIGGVCANLLLLIVMVYVLQTSPLVFLMVGASFSHLAYSTWKTYPVDGTLLVAWFFSAGMDVSVIATLVKPDLDLVYRTVFAHGCVLCMRVLIDVRQLMQTQ